MMLSPRCGLVTRRTKLRRVAAEHCIVRMVDAFETWRYLHARFISCSVWRQVAENVAESLTRGSRVVVHGRLKARSYDDRDGNKRTVFECDVEEIGASMRYATLKISKNSYLTSVLNPRSQEMNALYGATTVAFWSKVAEPPVLNGICV